MECAGNPSRSPTVRGICVVVTLLSSLLLTSCNSATIGTGDSGDIDVLDKVRSLDILPRQPQQVNASQLNAGQRSRAAVYEGTEVTDIAEVRPQRGTEVADIGGGRSPPPPGGDGVAPPF